MDIFILNLNSVENISIEILSQFKHKEITNPQKLAQHCFSYLMIDRILKEFYNIQNREIEFISNKPILKTAEKSFSISHSGKFVVIAFSDTNCGVDIEENKPRNFAEIAQRMKFNSTDLETFYEDWTLFEAKYKLNSIVKSKKTYKLENFTLTAVSENLTEEFNLYLQF